MWALINNDQHLYSNKTRFFLKVALAANRMILNGVLPSQTPVNYVRNSRRELSGCEHQILGHIVLKVFKKSEIQR